MVLTDLDKFHQIDLAFPRQKVAEVSSLFEIPLQQVFEPTPKEITDRAKNWVHSPGKKRFEQLFAKFAMFAGVEFLANATIRNIYRGGDQNRAIFTPQVGYPGDPRRFRLRKIQTMIENAEAQLVSPFDYPPLLVNRKKDIRVLNKEAARARRFGFDELFQIKQVAEGELRLFGIKALALQEIAIVEYLPKMFDLLGFDDHFKFIILAYFQAVKNLAPLPSLINPHTALGAKDLKIIPRLAADRLCLERESPVIDFRMATKSLVLRAHGVGAE